MRAPNFHCRIWGRCPTGGGGKTGINHQLILICHDLSLSLLTTLYLWLMIFSLPVFVMIGEPDCQYIWLPLPLTVILLQDTNKVMTFAFPRTSTALPLQVKVKV